MTGTKGGFTRLNSKSSHAMCLKNACFFTSSASFSLLPNLLSGFFLSNCYKILNTKDKIHIKKDRKIK